MAEKHIPPRDHYLMTREEIKTWRTRGQEASLDDYPEARDAWYKTSMHAKRGGIITRCYTTPGGYFLKWNSLIDHYLRIIVVFPDGKQARYFWTGERWVRS